MKKRALNARWRAGCRNGGDGVTRKAELRVGLCHRRAGAASTLIVDTTLDEALRQQLAIDGVEIVYACNQVQAKNPDPASGFCALISARSTALQLIAQVRRRAFNG
jgi:hypothetical protein